MAMSLLDEIRETDRLLKEHIKKLKSLCGMNKKSDTETERRFRVGDLVFYRPFWGISGKWECTIIGIDGSYNPTPYILSFGEKPWFWKNPWMVSPDFWKMDKEADYTFPILNNVKYNHHNEYCVWSTEAKLELVRFEERPIGK